jgi:hypothetical protein
MLTLEDVKERLSRFDEVTLLEVLNVSSEDIVDRFEDYILNKAEELSKELENE